MMDVIAEIMIEILTIFAIVTKGVKCVQVRGTGILKPARSGAEFRVILTSSSLQIIYRNREERELVLKFATY